MEFVSDIEWSLLYQGAEAKVYLGQMFGKDVVVKERLSKNYRIKELDQKLLKQRLSHEIRCMARCRRAGVLTPCVYQVDQSSHCIYMEYIRGVTAKVFVQTTENIELRERIARAIGLSIGQMHEAGVVHGDLTTSNIMIKNDENHSIVFIDFGLASTQPNIEDKAVDLYVLERAFISTHPGCELMIHNILDSYRFSGRDAGPVLQRLEQVRLRGRKRDMIG